MLTIMGIFIGSPIFLMIGLFLLVTSLSSENNKQASKKRNYADRPRDEKGRFTSYKNGDDNYSSDKLNSVYRCLNDFFKNHERYAVTRQLNLRSERYIDDLRDIKVYFENTYLCNLREFSSTHPNEYDKIMNSLIEFAKNRNQPKDVVDATFKEVDKRSKVVTEEPLSKAEKFAKQVDDFNNLIPDYRISLKLDKTSGLLRQISTLEVKNDGSEVTSLQKLYDYYMPMLNEILSSFSQLQNATTHVDHDATVEKVSNVIDTINDSMQTIINDMNDEDFINLNASLNTLETLLKNDGLVTDTKLDLSKAKAKAQAQNGGIVLTLDPNQQQAQQEEKDNQIKLDLDNKIGQLNDTLQNDAKFNVKG